MSTECVEAPRTQVESRILVVDDEADMAAMVTESLREADPSWEVISETDPARAVERLREEAFDCVVTDLVMPSVGGMELARAARDRDVDVALIAITGRGSLDSGVEALRLGFVDYLEKPFDLEALQKAVCRALRRRRRQMTLQQRFAELAHANASLESDHAQLESKLEIASHDLVLSNKRMARQMDDLAQTANMAQALVGVIELEDQLGLCAELIGDRIACDSCTVALYEAHDAAVGLMVRARPETDDAPALCWLRTPVVEGVMCRAAQARKSIHVEDVAGSVLLDEQERELWAEGRLLVVPVPHQGRSIGVAALHRPTGADDFGVDDIKTVTRLANVMGPTIQSARVHHKQRCEIYASLETVADAVEGRTAFLKGHSRRVLAYALALGSRLELTQAEAGAIQIAARLHDIGRVVIPDSVHEQPGPLAEAQWDIVQRHAEAGSAFLKTMDFFGEVGAIIRHHHESYDGTGYPDHKAGEEIPRVARILAVADALDAMTSPRPYREPLPMATARKRIEQLAGQQFDPAVVEALGSLAEETLEDIQRSHR